MSVEERWSISHSAAREIADTVLDLGHSAIRKIDDELRYSVERLPCFSVGRFCQRGGQRPTTPSKQRLQVDVEAVGQQDCLFFKYFRPLDDEVMNIIFCYVNQFPLLITPIIQYETIATIVNIIV